MISHLYGSELESHFTYIVMFNSNSKIVSVNSSRVEFELPMLEVGVRVSVNATYSSDIFDIFDIFAIMLHAPCSMILIW